MRSARDATCLLIVLLASSAVGCSAEEAIAFFQGLNTGLASGSANFANSEDVATITAPSASPVLADTRCFVVYVHGKDDADLSPGVATDADRRAYWQPRHGISTGDFVAASSREGSTGACETLVVGYDGRASFTDPAVSGSVARQIANFALQENVPDGRLVLIGHSMGGLVIRWILNRAADPDSNFALVVQKTRYAITLATPHVGSPAAEASVVGAPSLCAMVLAPLLTSIGMTPLNGSLVATSQSFMEPASAPSGIMGDDQRTRRIYAIGTTRWTGSMSIADDRHLTELWTCLGLTDCPFCVRTPGDGLVTLFSGLGVFERTGSAQGVSWYRGQRLRGPFTTWLSVPLNHNHVRYNDEAVVIHNYANGTDGTMAIGDYIAQNGLELE